MKIPRKRLDPVEMKLSPDCGDAEDDEVDGDWWIDREIEDAEKQYL